MLAVVSSCAFGADEGLREGAPPSRADDVLLPTAAKGLEVSAFQVEGLDSDLSRGLKSGLALSGESKLLGTKYPVFYPELLDDDLARTRLYLARRGYPYAHVDADLLRAKGGVRIVLRVTPGPAVRISDLSFSGLPHSVPEDRASAALEVGEVYTDGAVAAAVETIKGLLRDQGHATADVRRQVVRVDSTHVAVHFTVDPGPVFHFGDVSVTGISDDLVNLSRKVTGIKAGSRYAQRDLRDARDQLRLLGLFRQIRVGTEKAAPGTLDVTVQLTEREPRTIETGVGYWTDDGLSAHATWTHRNLFRRGRGLDVSGGYTQYNKDLSTSMWWPGLIGSKTWLQLRIGGGRETEASYDQTSIGGEISLLYRFALRKSIRGGIQITQNDVTLKTEDPVFLERPGRLASLFGEWLRDTGNDPLDPTEGTVSRLRLEWTPPGHFSDNYYAWGQGSETWYVPLPRRTVAATRVRVGLARPLGPSVDLLPSKRFFAGGASSNRGFERKRLGPKDSSGNPVGGEALLEASAELRFPLIRFLYGAMFVDVGQVWERHDQVDLSDLATGVGPALMVKTPVGPIRADVGFRLTHVDTDEPKVVFHILIGNPY